MKRGLFMKLRELTVAIAGFALAAGLASAALAADLPTTKGAPAAPPDWWSTLTVDGNIEGGIQFNPQAPTGQTNFGRLFDDKANEPLLNQATLTVMRPIDPSSKNIDFGFKLELLYGSDARYTHFLGECDYCIGNINQFDVVEAWGQVHLPYLAAGGIDVKAGQWVTLLGSEVIDAPSNIFYSHSYIFNYGIPLKDTGVLAVAHVNDTVDIYAGAITGVNTSVGWASPAFGDPGDNNNAPGFEGGIGLNKLFNGAVTVLAATNIAPDNANTPIGIAGCACNPNTDWRFLNDAVVTWTATDKLTLTAEGNYATDQSALVGSAYGAAGYASYQLLDWLKVNGRAEVFRDNSGFYVGGFQNNFDFVDVEHGYATQAPVLAAGPTTYGELTAGLTITPALPKETPYLKSVTIRPEVRWDTSLSGNTPYGTNGGNGTKSSQTTIGGDVILHF
ncbi:MAG TPA: outer membrane beta-barrel protein [Methylovirgula sp.]